MQRLYPVLLSISIALAVAIFLRPRLADDLTGFAASAWNSIGSAAQAAIGSEDARSSGGSGQTSPSYSAPSASSWSASTWSAGAASAGAEPAPANASAYPATDSRSRQSWPSTPAWQQNTAPGAAQNYPASGAPQYNNPVPAWPQNTAPLQSSPSGPAWQQNVAPGSPQNYPAPGAPQYNSAPASPQNAAPAWSQNSSPGQPAPSAPAWQQDPNYVGPQQPNWGMPPSGAGNGPIPNAATGNGSIPNVAREPTGWGVPPNGPQTNPFPSQPPTGYNENSPSNVGQTPAWSDRPATPGPAAPVWRIPDVPRQTEQVVGPEQTYMAPAQEASFVTSSAPPNGVTPNQVEEDRLRTASRDGSRALSGQSFQPGTAPVAADPSPDQVFAPPPGAAAGALPPDAQLVERSQIVARVGTEVILYGEISLVVPELRARAKNRGMSPQETERGIAICLKRDVLKPHIDTKLLYLDAKRTLPEEALKNFEKQVANAFDHSKIEEIMKDMKATSRQDLDAKLRSMNSSVEQQKRVFVQRMIAAQWLRQQVKVDDEVTYDQVLAYYREHPSEFDNPARVRWQQLMVRFSRTSDKEQAYRMIAEMGNQVLGGKDFAEVAKSGSHGPTAQTGGQRDWTSQGSLVSESLDKALFALPVGQLSPILEDEQGFHIVSVLERKEAGRTPLGDAKAEIQKKVRESREKGQEDAYLAKLREKTPVWTAFDDVPDDVPVSRRPQSPTGDSQTSRAGLPR